MNDERQQIAALLLHYLRTQGGDCRAADYVVGDKTVAELLDEYEAASEDEADAASAIEAGRTSGYLAVPTAAAKVHQVPQDPRRIDG